MFADLGIEKLLVLALIGLFVLGPERLPAALSWLSRTVGRACVPRNSAFLEVLGG